MFFMVTQKHVQSKACQLWIDVGLQWQLQVFVNKYVKQKKYLLMLRDIESTVFLSNSRCNQSDDYIRH